MRRANVSFLIGSASLVELTILTNKKLFGKVELSSSILQVAASQDPRINSQQYLLKHSRSARSTSPKLPCRCSYTLQQYWQLTSSHLQLLFRRSRAEKDYFPVESNCVSRSAICHTDPAPMVTTISLGVRICSSKAIT